MQNILNVKVVNSLVIICYWNNCCIDKIILANHRMIYFMYRRTNTTLILGILLMIGQISAQTNATVPVFKLPNLDNLSLIKEENQKRSVSPTRNFAHTMEVNISPNNSGIWINTNNTKVTWLMDIFSENAHSLNLGFSEYILAGDAQLSIYDINNNQKLGSFSALNNDLHKQLFTPLFETNHLRLELTCHPKYIDLIRLQLSTVNHGFIDIQKMLVSDACQIDVNCGAENGFPEIDALQQPIDAVGLITVNGISLCTGVLVNNTRYDFRPYLLTAEHCGINSQNASSVVVYWQYENSVCRTPDTEINAEMGDGSFNIYNSGSTLKAFHNPSDMTLLELDDPIPSVANAFFAGWNNTWEAPDNTFCVHHPSGEEKRISFDNDSPRRSFHFSESDVDGDHWRVSDWEQGSTEGGSSGAPLFNEMGRVIGQLHGGNAACGNDESDWFGSMAVSWEGGGTPETQLKYWLDPLGLEATTIEGIELEVVNPLLTFATINAMVNCHGESTAQVELQGIGGTLPYTYSIDGVEYFESPIFSDLPAGEYIFYVADAFGNIVASDFEITQPDPIQINPSVLLNEVNLEINGGVAPYQISTNNEDFESSVFIKFFDQGDQTIYVKDANGCLDSTTVNLAWEPLQVLTSVTSDIACFGDDSGAFEIMIQNGIAPYGVFIQNVFQEDLMFENQSAGNYDIMIVDSVLDTIFQTLVLEQPDELQLTVESTDGVIFAQAIGGSAPYQYSLDGESYQDASVFDSLEMGVYTVFVQDANSCQTFDNVEVKPVSTSNFDRSGMDVFPNPFGDQFYIHIPNNKTYKMNLVNAKGQVVHDQKLDLYNEINIFSLERGVYFLYIQGDTETWVKKLIKM